MPGDYIVYDIAELSFLVVRQDDGSIKAYPNACLHRGRQLKEYDGHCSRDPLRVPRLRLGPRRCSCQDVPAAWDFPHVDQRPDDFTLPECSVGTWAGFVFINPDPNAAPLAEHLGDIVEQFEVWDLGEPLRRGPRVADHPRQLEDRAGGVLRGVPRQRHAPPDPDLPRRRQQPGRRVGPLLAGRSRPAARRARCSATASPSRRCCAACSTCASTRTPRSP